jgi:hypothetical protein
MEKTESFGREFVYNAGQAGQVAAWSAKTGNK